RSELMGGQYLDLVEARRGAPDEAAVRRVLTYKSGKYTIERPLHLGLALAGGDPGLAQGYSAYGLPLGEAFQLRDDLLGAFGDETLTGKPVGEDLREGKPTLLYAAARSRLGAGDCLLERYGAADLSDDEMADLQDLFVETGAVAQVEATIDDRVTEALFHLEAAPLTGAAREALADLAHYVAGRDR
ncbi:MAG TPA: polyprenyl synthetase family protein, partial [Acidimicrobiales bacterium]